MTQISFKQGATFTAQCTYTAPAGGLPNLIGADITSQIRRGSLLVQDLTVTLAPDGMSFTVDGGDTSAWPVDFLSWDVRIDIDGSVYYTDTVQIQLQRSVTQAA